VKDGEKEGKSRKRLISEWAVFSIEEIIKKD